MSKLGLGVAVVASSTFCYTYYNAKTRHGVPKDRERCFSSTTTAPAKSYPTRLAPINSTQTNNFNNSNCCSGNKKHVEGNGQRNFSSRTATASVTEMLKGQQQYLKFNNNPLLLNLKLNAAEQPASEATMQDGESGDVFFMREQRFLSFASVFYNGEVYMTPQDFLHSVTQEGARARKYRLAVDDAKVKKWLKETPARKYGGTKMFRSLNEHGLISYVEYLFLLCILTEAKSGFEIAFNMFDIDGNQKVDIDEFKVLERILLTGMDSSSVDIRSERIKQIQTTTLLVHLFGANGKDTLKYADFARFTQNLQEEVLDMEFQQYAKGLKTISEEDFARILLRYTNLSESSIDEYLVRVRERIAEAKGINFADFKNFFLFLNHMDDFVLMMRLYNLTDQPISKEEFRRAVAICGGEDISLSVIDAVYTIFDVDGDGHLSTEEFISIMKSRLKRGLRTHLVQEEGGWPKFKKCVRHEMRIKRGGM